MLIAIATITHYFAIATTTGGRKVRHRADNAAIGGAVPPRWIIYLAAKGAARGGVR